MALVKKPVAKKAPAQDDIVMFVTSLEKLNSRAAAEESIRDLLERREKNIFMLGGCLSKLQMNPKWWDDSYANFKDYIESVLGIRYRKAMYAIDLYKRLLSLGVPWSAFGGIGWIKVNRLMKIVTKDNVAEWVGKAKVLSIVALEAAIEQAKNSAPAGDVPASDISTMTFKLHPDQKEILEAAIDKAQKEIGTEFKSVALEGIAQSYMGAGIAFTNWRQSLTFASKHVSTAEEFIGEVVAELEKLFPEGIIYAVYPSKDAAEKVAPAYKALFEQVAPAEAA